MEPVEWDAVAAAIVSLWFFVSAAFAGGVAVAAIRTGSFAPRLGLDVHGRPAAVAGWVTLAFAIALFAAGILVSRVAAFG